MDKLTGYLEKDPRIMYAPSGEKTTEFSLMGRHSAWQVHCKTDITQVACKFLHEGDWVEVTIVEYPGIDTSPGGWPRVAPLVANRIDFLYTAQNVATEICEMFDTGIIYKPVKTF